MSYWNKDKKNTNQTGTKKRTNWNQSLRSASGVKVVKTKRIKKSLQYLLLLKNLTIILTTLIFVY